MEETLLGASVPILRNTDPPLHPVPTRRLSHPGANNVNDLPSAVVVLGTWVSGPRSIARYQHLPGEIQIILGVTRSVPDQRNALSLADTLHGLRDAARLPCLDTQRIFN